MRPLSPALSWPLAACVHAAELPVNEPVAPVLTEPAALVLEGTPPVPAELAARLRPYLEARSADLADLAPDGRSMLIRTRFGDHAQLHRVDMPMGARTQLSFGDEPARRASFSPDGAALLTSRDRGGDEQYQLWRVDPGAGTAVQLSPPGGRSGGWVASQGGDRIAFTSTARNGKDSDLYLSDGLHPDSTRLLAQGEGTWWVDGWSPDDRQLLVTRYVSANESELWTVDAETGSRTRLDPDAAPSSTEGAAWGPTGDTVYCATDRGGEFRSLQVLSLKTVTWTSLTADIPWDVEQLARSRDGSRLAFTTNEGGISRLHLLDPRSQQIRRVPGLPDGILSSLDFSDDGAVLAFQLGTATTPGDVYSLDTATEALTRWTASEVGGLDSRRFIAPSLVHFPSFDGRQIPAFYYAAPGEGPHPVVIFIHGGPESQSRPHFSALTQTLLLDSGISVLVPNVRGSSGYGKSWLLLDNGFKREDSVRDVGALLSWIATQPALDADRVAVVGGSYGGYMVLATLSLFPGKVKAGIDSVGIANFVTFLEQTGPYRQDLRRAEYGDERDPEMRAFLQRISPVNRAHAIDAALFVAHGANDPRVPVGEARQIVDAVLAQGGDTWLMLAGNEGHGFRKRENSDLYRLLEVLFLETHLGVRPPPESP